MEHHNACAPTSVSSAVLLLKCVPSDTVTLMLAVPVAQVASKGRYWPKKAASCASAYSVGQREAR